MADATPVVRITPTVSQTTRSDWLSWADQLLEHAEPMIETGVQLGLTAAEGMIPGGSIIRIFVGEKIVHQLVSQGVSTLEAVLGKIPEISADGTHPVTAYVIQMINNASPRVLAWLEPEMDALIKSGLAKIGASV